MLELIEQGMYLCILHSKKAVKPLSLQIVLEVSHPKVGVLHFLHPCMQTRLCIHFS